MCRPKGIGMPRPVKQRVAAPEQLNVIIKLKGSAGQCAPCSPEKHPVPKSVLSPQRQQQAAASELANAMELSVREELRLADTLEEGVEMLRKLIDERAELKSECPQPESLGAMLRADQKALEHEHNLHLAEINAHWYRVSALESKIAWIEQKEKVSALKISRLERKLRLAKRTECVDSE